MYVSKLQLVNFKRFSDLTIDLSGLETPPRLVLLIGANGSGKSSVFDAFGIFEGGENAASFDFSKGGRKNYSVVIKGSQNIYADRSIDEEGVSGGASFVSKTAFYGRSALRQIPILHRTDDRGDSVKAINDNTDRPTAYNDIDSRFISDIDYLLIKLIEGIFEVEKTSQILNQYIEPINEAFQRIFNFSPSLSLRLSKILPPRESHPAVIQFEKGSVKNLHYDDLSNGEKEVFNILLNLLIRKEFFRDTVYFIDELDLHLNTLLQKSLLKEIVENWLPQNCQLWTASHSLGFIEYASESKEAAIIDLDNLDFDQPQVLYPAEKTGYEVFEIAVPSSSLSALLSDKRIIFAERTNAELYNTLRISDLVFVDAIDRNDVYYRSTNPPYEGLADRDLITDEERMEIMADNERFFLLNYYCFENYLYHPENYQEYFFSKSGQFDMNDYRNKILTEKKKNQLIIASKIQSSRATYPYFKKEGMEVRKKKFILNTSAVVEMLGSDDFETFYKVFSMKEYCGAIRPKNIRTIDLASTNWFKTQIQNILERK